VKNLSKFLETEPRQEMETMLVEERCPRKVPLAERQTIFEEIIDAVSQSHAERLSSASRAYESRWSLPAFGL